MQSYVQKKSLSPFTCDRFVLKAVSIAGQQHVELDRTFIHRTAQVWNKSASPWLSESIFCTKNKGLVFYIKYETCISWRKMWAYDQQRRFPYRWMMDIFVEPPSTPAKRCIAMKYGEVIHFKYIRNNFLSWPFAPTCISKVESCISYIKLNFSI